MLYCLRTIKLNWLPTTPFLAYMHGTCLKVGKHFVRTQYNVLVFLIVCAKGMRVPIELSEDCYCDRSVQIPNGYTIDGTKFLKLKVFFNQFTNVICWLDYLRIGTQALFEMEPSVNRAIRK